MWVHNTRSKKYLTLVILIVITILVHYTWFFGQGILNYNDWFYLHNEFISQYFQNQSTWQNYRSLGGFFLQLMTIVFYNLLSKISQLGASYDTAVRVVFLIPIALLAPIGFFLLINKITRSLLSAFVA